LLLQQAVTTIGDFKGCTLPCLVGNQPELRFVLPSFDFSQVEKKDNRIQFVRNLFCTKQNRGILIKKGNPVLDLKLSGSLVRQEGRHGWDPIVVVTVQLLEGIGPFQWYHPKPSP